MELHTPYVGLGPSIQKPPSLLLVNLLHGTHQLVLDPRQLSMKQVTRMQVLGIPAQIAIHDGHLGGKVANGFDLVDGQKPFQAHHCLLVRPCHIRA
jgi:hypothetical protein